VPSHRFIVRPSGGAGSRTNPVTERESLAAMGRRQRVEVGMPNVGENAKPLGE
jgi:hypothetical protein